MSVIELYKWRTGIPKITRLRVPILSWTNFSTSTLKQNTLPNWLLKVTWPDLTNQIAQLQWSLLMLLSPLKLKIFYWPHVRQDRLHVGALGVGLVPVGLFLTEEVAVVTVKLELRWAEAIWGQTAKLFWPLLMAAINYEWWITHYCVFSFGPNCSFTPFILLCNLNTSVA